MIDLRTEPFARFPPPRFLEQVNYGQVYQCDKSVVEHPSPFGIVAPKPDAEARIAVAVRGLAGAVHVYTRPIRRTDREEHFHMTFTVVGHVDRRYIHASVPATDAGVTHTRSWECRREAILESETLRELAPPRAARAATGSHHAIA